MRRTAAIVLLVVFSFSLIPAGLFAHTESSLPTCCRRDGKHHCSMKSMSDVPSQPSGTALRDAGRKCPLYPLGNATPAVAKASTPRPANGLAVPILHPFAEAERTEALYRISFNRGWQKRGPPSPLS